MIVKERKIIPFNDGCWSENVYVIYGKKPMPSAIVDEENGYVYKPMCTQYGLKLYHREEL